MTTNLPPKVVSRRGMTLLELTIVISAILALVSVLLAGSRAWKRGGDRASCILVLRNVQMATRCYQNLYGYNCGGRPSAENGSRDIARHLFEKGYIERHTYDQATGLSHCPSGGSYSRVVPDIFPALGELYLNCSLSNAEGHKPASSANW